MSLFHAKVFPFPSKPLVPREQTPQRDTLLLEISPPKEVKKGLSKILLREITWSSEKGTIPKGSQEMSDDYLTSLLGYEIDQEISMFYLPLTSLLGGYEKGMASPSSYSTLFPGERFSSLIVTLLETEKKEEGTPVLPQYHDWISLKVSPRRDLQERSLPCIDESLEKTMMVSVYATSRSQMIWGWYGVPLSFLTYLDPEGEDIRLYFSGNIRYHLEGSYQKMQKKRGRDRLGPEEKLLLAFVILARSESYDDYKRRWREAQ